VPAVGIVLILIGLWLLVRTLRGGLAPSLSRTIEAGGAQPSADQAAATGPQPPVVSKPSAIARAPAPRPSRRTLHLSPTGLAHAAF